MFVAGGAGPVAPRPFLFGTAMFDEIAFQFHMLETWWYLHRDSLWFIQAYTRWPVTLGIVTGFLCGYFTEDVVMFCEKHAGRRAMRQRLRRASNRRKEK